MGLLCALVVRVSLLLVLPLSDLAISLATPHVDYSLVLSYMLCLLQSWLYIHRYRPLSRALFVLSCCSFLIYFSSLVVQLSLCRNGPPHTRLAGYHAGLSSSASNLFARSQSSLNSSMINNFTNSISNSISLSPAITTLSKRSTDMLMFKIDDVISPRMQTSQQQKGPTNAVLMVAGNREQNAVQEANSSFNLGSDSVVMPLLKSSKTSPIMATLLALSAPAPSNAAPIINMGSTAFQSYDTGSVLNFLLATVISMVALGLSSRPSPLYLFKSLISGMAWLLILLVEHPFTSMPQSKIVILFDNKLLIMPNAIMAAASVVISVLTMLNNTHTLEGDADKRHVSDPDSKTGRTDIFDSYLSISEL